MIKLSDYVAKYLFEHNIKDVFLISGGGAMHLNDSFGKFKAIKYHCNHHEQASAIGAEGYYRATGRMCAVNVTTGPGGLNTLTGVMGQWTDSVPVIYISGQVKYETTIKSCPSLKLRQLGDQEVDIISVVKPLTKYSVMITDPLDIKYVLDKAFYEALSGRPGPVWIDIPLNIQAAFVDEKKLRSFTPEVKKEKNIESSVKLAIKKIKESKRPVIYVGGGVRIASAQKEFFKMIDKLKIPVVTAISGTDLVCSDHYLNYGRPGICGNRLGNIMVQNSDLLLIIGTRLGIRQTGYEFKKFAPNAYKIMIDIDKNEMDKPTLKIDLKIESDIKTAINSFLSNLGNQKLNKYTEWLGWGRYIEKKLPSILDDNKDCDKYVNSFRFALELGKLLKDGDLVVTGNGTAYTGTYQIMPINKGVRLFANQGCASMGYDLPAAIGASIGRNKKSTIVITGDGSIQMNLQELQTINSSRLPIKIFVLENDGYLAIKTTQTAFFKGNFCGSNPKSGVVCSSMKDIARAFNLKYFAIKHNKNIKNTIKRVLEFQGPAICEIKMNPLQTLYPKAYSAFDENGKIYSKPLQDMFPILPENILEECSKYCGDKD